MAQPADLQTAFYLIETRSIQNCPFEIFKPPQNSTADTGHHHLTLSA
ncbi:Uncharacterised protein [Neisseria animalis]|nr:Uncharacterised protein [Neisseria animalis]